MDTQTPANVQEKDGKSPDPSVLATQQLWREISSLKELILMEIKSLKKAAKIAHEDMVRFPTEIDKRVDALKELHNIKINGGLEALSLKIMAEHNLKEEKFNKVDQRFHLIETNRTEQKAEAATALNTALSAQKEAVLEQNKTNLLAVNKSEAATTKQIEQLGNQQDTSTKNTDDKINDIKDRLTKIEGMLLGFAGMKDQISALRTGSDQGKGKIEGYAQFIGWIAFGITFIGFLIMLYSKLK